MTALGAMAAGVRRALGSPVILLWLWIVNLVVAAPAAWLVAGAIGLMM